MNTRGKYTWGKKWIVCQIILPQLLKVLGMLHYFSSMSTVSFVYQCKDILTEALCIADKIGHPKIKNRGK